jgi:hypothetical protein
MSNGGFRTNVPFQSNSGEDWGSAIYREYHRQQVRDSSGRFGGGWGFAWQGLSEVADNMEAYGIKFTGDGPLRQKIEALKDEMVAWAKDNAPWKDRTTDAREGLQGAVVWSDATHFTIFLGHGKDIYYGIWLEVRWGGKYAIVLPTIHHFAPQIGDKIRTMT